MFHGASILSFRFWATKKRLCFLVTKNTAASKLNVIYHVVQDTARKFHFKQAVNNFPEVANASNRKALQE
ncbi:hypothetical protein [Enterocloster clostridioformis]|uniref:hypothetical protein n=1 Tax=Enterocloster clostridioformis TaxID=1531 RepID=UPI0032BF24AE